MAAAQFKVVLDFFGTLHGGAGSYHEASQGPELELELKQPQVIQKSMFRGQVGACAWPGPALGYAKKTPIAGRPPWTWPAALECRVSPSQASRLPRTERTDEFASARTRARQEPNSERKVANSAAPAHMHSSHAAQKAPGAAACISTTCPRRAGPCGLRCVDWTT